MTTTTILYMTLLFAGQPTTNQEYPTPEACIEAVKALTPIYRGYTQGACIDKATGKLVIKFDRS